jgi:hypothetical protein
MVLALLLCCALLPAACGSSRVSSAASPRPAASIFVLPGMSAGNIGSDSPAYQAAANRLIIVFIKEATPAAKIEATGRQIAAMPEVTAYNFRTDYHGKVATQAFAILVRDLADVRVVAQRFSHNSLVNRLPWSPAVVVPAWVKSGATPTPLPLASP